MNQPCTTQEPEAKRLNQQSKDRETSSETQDEVRKYVRFLPKVAEPNLARVREIREQIKQGTYLNREMIEETAGRLAIRFLRKEQVFPTPRP